MPTLSVSTWSLHRALGATYPSLDLSDGAREARYPYGAGDLTLLDAPAVVAPLGIANLEIVHFHFPRTDPDYLAALRARLDAAGVAPATLLIDAGDLTAADERLRPRLTHGLIREVVADLPDAWLGGEALFADLDAHRAAYVTYLGARLDGPRRWLDEAIVARGRGPERLAPRLTHRVGDDD